MMRYDGDAAVLLVHFRASLEVVPERDPRSEEQSLALRRNCAAGLWEGLRRVHFGEVERNPPVVSERQIPDEDVMENLRKEIEELEQRLRTRGPPEDSGRGLLCLGTMRTITHPLLWPTLMLFRVLELESLCLFQLLRNLLPPTRCYSQLNHLPRLVDHLMVLLVFLLFASWYFCQRESFGEFWRPRNLFSSSGPLSRGMIGKQNHPRSCQVAAYL
jgi:hypothetical protein